MTSPTRARVGAASAILGGVFWVVKGGAILLTGIQPPLLFEIAPFLFALGLIGLHARLDGRGGFPGRFGLGAAMVSGALGVLALVRPPTSSGESFSPVIFGSFLANLIGLVLLGIATRRTRALPDRWRLLPLVMGISTFPLMAVGGALESVNERLLEIPLVLLGLVWIWLGYLVWSSSTTMVRGDAHAPTA